MFNGSSLVCFSCHYPKGIESKSDYLKSKICFCQPAKSYFEIKTRSLTCVKVYFETKTTFAHVSKGIFISK